MLISKIARSLALSREDPVRKIWRSGVAAFALALLCSGPVAAGTLAAQINDDLSIGEQLVSQEHSLDQAQKQLGDARTSLLARGAALEHEQQALNSDVDLHNQQVSEQKDAINKNRQQCNSKGNLNGDNTTEHINQCNNSIKAINGSSAAIDGQSDTLASRQAALDTRFAEYRKEVDAWNKQAAQTSDSVTQNRKRKINWLNFSYGLLASPEFQREVRNTKETQACGSSIEAIEASAREPADDSVRFVLACLRAIRRHEGT